MKMIDTGYLIAFFRLAAERLEDARVHLCTLDGQVGDGDHGTSMANGFLAVTLRLRTVGAADLPPDAVLREAAQAFLAEVGASVGPLYASGFLSAARALAEGPLPRRDLHRLLEALAEGIAQRGRAVPGDKTMLDAWIPAAQAAARAAQTGEDEPAIAEAASLAASRGMEATATMVAARGRAARLADRTLGHVDPGAASAALLVRVLADLARDDA